MLGRTEAGNCRVLEVQESRQTICCSEVKAILNLKLIEPHLHLHRNVPRGLDQGLDGLPHLQDIQVETAEGQGQCPDTMHLVTSVQPPQDKTHLAATSGYEVVASIVFVYSRLVLLVFPTQLFRKNAKCKKRLETSIA